MRELENIIMRILAMSPGGTIEAPDRLRQKIKWAILAVEIATRIVYRGGWEQDFENRLRSDVKASAGQAGGA